jgi:hypothetical protein
MRASRVTLFLIWVIVVFPLSGAAEGPAVSAGDSYAAAMSALAADPGLVLFKAGPFDPAQGLPGEALFGLSEGRDRDVGTLCYVVQFPCVPGPGERALLSEAGAEILYYLPNNAYLVSADAGACRSLATALEVRLAFRLPKFAKIDPILTSGEWKPGIVELVAVPGVSAAPAADALAKRFPDLRFVTDASHHKRGRVVCAVPEKTLPAFLDEASGMEDVLSILPW